VHINISLVGLGLGLVTLVLDFDCLVVVVWLRNVSLSGQWFNKFGALHLAKFIRAVRRNSPYGPYGQFIGAVRRTVRMNF